MACVRIIAAAGIPIKVVSEVPPIKVLVVDAGPASGYLPSDNMRRKVSGNGTFDQVIDPDTGLFHTIMVENGQVVCGPGEA